MIISFKYILTVHLFTNVLFKKHAILMFSFITFSKNKEYILILI